MIGVECVKGRMPTKIELTLEQSQQGVSYDVLFGEIDRPKKYQVELEGALSMLQPRSSEVKVILSSFQCQITVWGDSMNYVPVIASTTFNDFVEKGASFNLGQSCIEIRPSQENILMSLWNEGSLFDSSPKVLDGDNKDNNGPNTKSEIDNQNRPNAKHSTKDINTIGPNINTASSNFNTASPTVNTVRLSDDIFGADKDIRSFDEVKLDISNIATPYPVPTTLKTRINKDHSLDNMIGDIQFGVQPRRMTVTTDEQGFISAIYKEKTHEDLHTCLFA
nr:hypothetical protein [Tanacetum cinerariifolium]